jgi:hypothetical protein
VLLQLHAHEGLQAQAQLARLQARAIADDHALAFQPLQAAQAGRGRKIHPRRQFGVGGAPIPLDFSQQAYIRAIELDFSGHCCPATW